MKKKRISRVALSDRILDLFIYIFLGVLVISCIYPVYFVIIASVSDATAVNSGRLLLWPSGFHTSGYQYVLSDNRILTGYLNTFIYTVGGTLLGLAGTIPAGYALSRKDLPFRGLLMGLFVFTMYFSGGLIPTYLVVRTLGLVNTQAIIIIMGSITAYNIILVRTFFQNTIPQELQEAAFIDGCGNIRFFFSFAIPLSSAIIAVIALYLAVSYWNGYFNALIYLTDRSKMPLQIFLREILLSQASADIADGDLASDYKRMVQVIKYAVIVIATLPIMCLYPFLQKYFVKGVMIGSVKG